jgi:hypothetical protein
LEALRKAAQLNDPEIHFRAESIIRRIERRPVPGNRNEATAFLRSIRMSLVNGVRIIDIKQVGRVIQIQQGSQGIEMKVTANENGKAISETYKALDEETLQRDNPEAAELYKKWTKTVATWPMRNGLMIQDQGGFVVEGPVFQIYDPLETFRERVEGQMKDAKLPEKDVLEVGALLDKVQLSHQPMIGVMLQQDKDLNQYFANSDELRRKLAELKLPEPGDELPPPPHARLGVSLRINPERGLWVNKVIAGGRAEKLGIMEGDLIQKVNGKEVRDIIELKRLLEAANNELIIEGLRDEKELRLVEGRPATQPASLPATQPVSNGQ